MIQLIQLIPGRVGEVGLADVDPAADGGDLEPRGRVGVYERPSVQQPEHPAGRDHRPVDLGDEGEVLGGDVDDAAAACGFS